MSLAAHTEGENTLVYDTHINKSALRHFLRNARPAFLVSKRATPRGNAFPGRKWPGKRGGGD